MPRNILKGNPSLGSNISRQFFFFFYLQKSYNTEWKFGVLKDLHILGINGRLNQFIQIFMKDQIFQVSICIMLSELQNQERVPERRILSVTLFCVYIYSEVKSLSQWLRYFCIFRRLSYAYYRKTNPMMPQQNKQMGNWKWVYFFQN